MNKDEFTTNSPGRLTKIEKGCWAFIPNPLPPKIDLTWDLVSTISTTDRALSELAGVARTLPNPHLLINPFIRREAVLSSKIEGTQASLSDLLMFEGAGQKISDTQHSDVQEVMNYVNALELGLDRLKKLPVSIRLINEMHKLLMTGVRGDNLSPGEFRKIQNWIGPPNAIKQNATYVPPPIPEMKQAMSELEKFIHAKTNLPPLIRLALIHYQFEAIHPYIDGNGRIGRLLITLMLCADELLPQPLLYLSAYIEHHRRKYYQLLLDVSQKGAWSEWINFFLQGVTEQSLDAIKRSRLLLDLQQQYREKMQATRSSTLTLKLIDKLFAQPVMTVNHVGHLLDITPRAAQLNVNKLVEAGILEETTGRQRNRIFIAPEVVRIVEAPKV